MLVFISWSGQRSKVVAEALENWLAQVIQAVEPWISQDIDKGLRWGAEIADRLERSKVGIICLTKSNLESKWIHYEAGALSKTKDAYVCTLLLGIKHVEVEQPLAQFQHTTTEKEQIFKLLKTINQVVGTAGERVLPESRLREVFETYWPRLEEAFKESASLQESGASPSRSDSEMLQEVLEILRNQERRQPRPAKQPEGTEALSYDDVVRFASHFQQYNMRDVLSTPSLKKRIRPPADERESYINRNGLDNYLIDVLELNPEYVSKAFGETKDAGEFLDYISRYPTPDEVMLSQIASLYDLDDSYLNMTYLMVKARLASKGIS